MAKKKDIFDDLILPTDEEIRTETRIKKMSISKTGVKGPKHTDESKRKIGIAHTGLKKPARTKEVKKIVSQKLTNRKRSEKECEAISAGLMGHETSTSRRENISKGLTGVMKGVPKPKTICPHCGVEGAIATMHLHHFDKCNTRTVIVGTNIKTGKIIKLSGSTQIKNAGFSYGNILSCVRGDRKSHKGYTWAKEAKN